MDRASTGDLSAAQANAYKAVASVWLRNYQLVASTAVNAALDALVSVFEVMAHMTVPGSQLQAHAAALAAMRRVCDTLFALTSLRTSADEPEPAAAVLADEEDLTPEPDADYGQRIV